MLNSEAKQLIEQEVEMLLCKVEDVLYIQATESMSPSHFDFQSYMNMLRDEARQQIVDEVENNGG